MRWLQPRFERRSTPIRLQFDRATTIQRHFTTVGTAAWRDSGHWRVTSVWRTANGRWIVVVTTP